MANAKNIIADKDILGVIGHLNSGVAIPSSEVYKEVDPGDDLAGQHQPDRHRPELPERQPRVRARRRPGRGGRGVRRASSKAKSVYVIHDKTTYGQGVAEFFKADAEKKGIKVLGFEGTEEKSNFDPIITPMKAKNPDLVYFGGIYDQAGAVLQAGAREGREGEVPGAGRHGLVRPGEDRRQGRRRHVLHLGGRPGLRLPAGQEFADEYKKKFGKNPEPFAAAGLRRHRDRAQGDRGGREGRQGAEPRGGGGRHPQGQVHRASPATIEFDAKGDPKKALYFVLQVVERQTPRSGATTRKSKRLTIAAPRPRSRLTVRRSVPAKRDATGPLGPLAAPRRSPWHGLRASDRHLPAGPPRRDSSSASCTP